jgi:hypothetical protein
MISWILKSWRLLLDIAIVVALCVAFSYFDPFHMFRKAGLQQTANMVTNIKAIGQLVTAEYYGEVIASQTEMVETVLVNNSQLAEDFYNELLDAVEKYEKDANKKKQEFHEHAALNYLRSQYPDYKYLVWYFAGQLCSVNNSRIDHWFEKDKMEKIEDELFKTLSQNRNPASKIVLDNFGPFLKDQKKEELKKKIVKQKEEIILIGRGTVKAGFDFGTLNERNFLYNKTTKQIKLYGISVQVLDTIINPWFIPQLEVEGYTFVSDPKTTDYSQVIEVKNKCRIKLAQQAFKAGLIEQAQQNGAEVLKNFFSVLMDEPQLTVSFNAMPYDDLLNEITADDTISVQETHQISDLLQRYRRIWLDALPDERPNLDFEQQIIINNLKACVSVTDDRPFNPYSLAFAQLERVLDSLPQADSIHFRLSGKTLDSAAVFRQLIATLRDTLAENDLGKTSGYTTPFLKANPYWYADTARTFMSDFNSNLQAFRKQHRTLYIDSLRYTVVEFPTTLFDTIGLSKLNTIDSLITASLKKQPFNYTQERQVMITVETKNARYRQEVKPLKKFTDFVEKITH